ncbi:hypothetical protein [Kineosporia succinea]|uniref:Type II secretory pathway pseudopilin PulG n=1 Tax=Kineosporia succinea TaxID=84632 RepID=A0ABT9P0X3_9ACTN|nr:hypothetical protein [Kineosporia succinea]MDP9826323.1 type II secretory pathway pseudopilin PulG [Kineosporia succinea]
MSTRRKRAKAKKEAQAQFRSALESARTGGAVVAERAYPAAVATRDRVSVATKDHVVPAVRNAAEHAGPALEKGYAQAREKAAPVVAHGRDKVVDDLLPKLAEAIAAASAAAIAARDNASVHAQERAAVAVQHLPANKKALKKARRKQRRRRFVLFSLIAAAAGGAAVAWQKRNAQQDPWTPDPGVTTVNGASNGTPLATPGTPSVPVEEAEAGKVTGDPILGDPKSDR